MGKEKRMLVYAGIACVALTGCTSHAPDIKGRWSPVNRFAESPRAIPLQPRYVFFATPADGTLKRLLERWARDSGKTLAYQAPDDFTLHAPAARIRTTDLARAADELTAAYAGQGLRIAVDPERIVVSGRDEPVADKRRGAR